MHRSNRLFQCPPAHVYSTFNCQLLLVIAVLFIQSLPVAGYGAVNSYSKNGNEFSTVDGQYATATHCTSSTCPWVVGDGMILGVYSSSTATWTGGTAMWEFPVTESLSSVQAAEVRIERPVAYGKGLHSPALTGNAEISIGTVDNSIANS